MATIRKALVRFGGRAAVAGYIYDSETLLRRAIDIIATARTIPLSASPMINRDEIIELLQLQPKPAARIVKGSIRLEGVDLLDGVGEVGMNDNPVDIGDNQERRVFQGLAVAEELLSGLSGASVDSGIVMNRSRLALTAAASTRVPSWKRARRCSVRCSVLPSLRNSHFVASIGRGSPVLVRRISRS